MIPARFDYAQPTSLPQAVSVLSDAGEDAKVLAGGQSLLPLLRMRLAYPSVLVDVGCVSELRGVRDEGDHLFVGAMTTQHDLVRDPLIREHCPLVSLTAATVADPAVRHRGTIGGSLAHADPAGDLPSVAVALDMVFVTRSPREERRIAAADFFLDYLESALETDEILVGLEIPKLGPGWTYHYEKFHRTAQAWAIVGAAVAVRRADGHIAEARIGLTNMAPVPVRASSVEAAVAGAAIDDDVLRRACATADEGTSPASDLHATPEYRRHLARVLTRRALATAARA
ncbi:FAD binding domain-containing protein [Bailinhaonella thermotolerans]|uniref:Xanthine dehydrogenase family protein subunit M n=1 Tax=Bailinhaonella thermotolerans TaxID=1070861 RepID=A0A3A4A595_9ACTN|nr:xanthine dehydrogenase family protein subunit M [Bailinhaonella thermotolerans]RJL23685.1 xanthine dehydrogenase family protein subunit M [Bailinhaonella thermotolerans]